MKGFGLKKVLLQRLTYENLQNIKTSPPLWDGGPLKVLQSNQNNCGINTSLGRRVGVIDIQQEKSVKAFGAQHHLRLLKKHI